MALNQANTPDGVATIFNTTLDSIPHDDPKKGDFLWRLVRGSERLNNTIAEFLAYEVAARAGDYQYDIMYIGEGAFALNIVFMVAQKVAATLSCKAC